MVGTEKVQRSEEEVRAAESGWLNPVQEAAHAALEREIFAGSRVHGILNAVLYLDREGRSVARKIHEELVEYQRETLELCGYVDVELVPVVNGLKKFIEERGDWVYQNGGWQPWPSPEAAK